MDNSKFKRSKIEELLNNDSSYQLVTKRSDTPHGRSLFRLFGGKPQTPEREAYESGAKIYYERGFEDGQNCCSDIANRNVKIEDYDMVMRLLSMLGLSFSYFQDVPTVMKESLNKCGVDPYAKFHPGLNLVQDHECMLSVSEVERLRLLINSFHEQLINGYKKDGNT